MSRVWANRGLYIPVISNRVLVLDDTATNNQGYTNKESCIYLHTVPVSSYVSIYIFAIKTSSRYTQNPIVELCLYVQHFMQQSRYKRRDHCLQAMPKTVKPVLLLLVPYIDNASTYKRKKSSSDFQGPRHQTEGMGFSPGLPASTKRAGSN